MINYTHWFIRARLKTRQLLLLVALDEEGNIHRAAEVLKMTQPAASKLLKDVEDVLGVPLFDRLPRGMRPTAYGEAMIRHARSALASLNQAHDEVQALKAGRFGQVSGGRHHHARHHAAAAGDRAREAAHPTCACAAGRDQRRADGAADRGQARHHRGPPVRPARQDGSCASRRWPRNRRWPSCGRAIRCCR
jgi:DNA-binding transcriptional LysR family regulator